MADAGELRNMVMSFRVSELQVLLGFAGRNRSGRKSELLSRALSLLDKGCGAPIQIKIRELYRRRFPKTGVCSAGSDITSLAIKTPSLSMTSSSSTGGVLSSPTSPYPSSSPLDYPRGSAAPPSSSQVPVHPDVRFKRLPFYDVLGELLKPSSLAPRTSARFQETFFVFHMTPQQAQDISMSRDLRPGTRCEYQVQVQLRFCLLETSCHQEDNFPPSICVRVNGKMAPLPNPIPTNKPGVDPKRPSRPVNITSICRISPTVANHINISWASELGRSYCVAIYLVRRLSSDVLLSRLKQKGVRHPDHTRALIKEKLAHDPESEIATTSLRVSLMCPLGKMRMSVPSRAKTCNHLQCFDAPMFLQMNEKKPTWTCPVCDRVADFDDLILDGLFSELLTEASDACEIQFTEDGQWQPMREREEKQTAQTAGADVHMIGDNGDSDCEAGPTVKAPEASTSSGGGGGGMVIDLTETDDEEDNQTIILHPDASGAADDDTTECKDMVKDENGWKVVQNSPLKIQLKKLNQSKSECLGGSSSSPPLHVPVHASSSSSSSELARVLASGPPLPSLSPPSLSPPPPTRHLRSNTPPPSLRREEAQQSLEEEAMDLDADLSLLLMEDESTEPLAHNSLMSSSELESLLQPLSSSPRSCNTPPALHSSPSRHSNSNQPVFPGDPPTSPEIIALSP